MGCKESRGDLDRMVTRLPPPSAYEKRLDEIDAELMRLRKELGPGATVFGYYKRKYPPISPGGASSIPSLDSLVKAASTKKDPNAARYAGYDGLHELRDQLGA